MKKNIDEVISELKEIAVEIEKDPSFDVTLEKAEKDDKKSKKADKAKEEESEEGGSEGKIKENKPLDAEETSLGKPKKEIPGAKEIVHFNDKSDLAKEEIAKDDKPHAKDSPEDKAHDTVEEKEPVSEALRVLNSIERQKMLQHLRTLKDKSKQRSSENQALGKKEDGASAYLDCKKEFKKAWASEKAKKQPKDEMKKMGAPAPKQDAGRAPASWASAQTAPNSPAWQTPQSGSHAGMNPAQRASAAVMGKAKMDEGKTPESKQEARRERNLRIAIPKAGGKEKMEGTPTDKDPLSTKLRLRKEELDKGSAAPAPAPAPKPSMPKPSIKKPGMPKPPKPQPTMQMAEKKTSEMKKTELPTYEEFKKAFQKKLKAIKE
jgi:hypothetical protein